MRPREWIVFGLITLLACGPLAVAACSAPKAVDCRVEFAQRMAEAGCAAFDAGAD